MNKKIEKLEMKSADGAAEGVANTEFAVAARDGICYNTPN